MSVRDQLDDYVLGVLDDAQRAAVEAALSVDPSLRAALAEVESTWALLGESLEPVQPSAAVLTRLHASLDNECRFERFVDKVASLLDVVASTARDLLTRIDDATSWEPSPWPHIELFHIAGGSKVAGAITGFVRLPPGSTFPDHEHIGLENVLIVQGSCLDHVDGSIATPGTLVVREPGTAHAFTVQEGPPLVYLAVVFDGIRVGELELKPGDPNI